MAVVNDFIGKAVYYPLQIKAGSVAIAGGVDNIEGSLIMILTTPLGTRPMLPDYGCRIDELLYDPNDEVQQTLVSTIIRDAITKWEKRIALLKITTASKDDMMLCFLDYRILATNEFKTFVFPFGRLELPY